MRREHEPDEQRRAPSASAASTAVAMRGSQCRIPVQHRHPELALERGARLLRHRVERRRAVRVVDPERAVARDEVVEELRPDRPAAADVRVVGGDVDSRSGEPYAIRTTAGLVMPRPRLGALVDERDEPREHVRVRLGEHAVAEVEDVARAGRRRGRGRRAPRARRRPSGPSSAAGSRFPCTARSGTSAQPSSSGEAPVEPDHVAAGRGELAERGGPRPCRSGSSARRPRRGSRALHGATPLAVVRRARARRPRSRRAGSRPRRRRPWPRRRPRTSRPAAPSARPTSRARESISAFVRGSSRLGRPSTR